MAQIQVVGSGCRSSNKFYQLLVVGVVVNLLAEKNSRLLE